MRASKSISEFNPSSGENGPGIREKGDKIDSNKLRGAETEEKTKDEEAPKEEPKKKKIH